MKRLDLIILLRETTTRLCRGCREQIPFNMNGSHGFDIHARKCEAEELRNAIKELEKDNV